MSIFFFCFSAGDSESLIGPLPVKPFSLCVLLSTVTITIPTVVKEGEFQWLTPVLAISVKAVGTYNAESCPSFSNP